MFIYQDYSIRPIDYNDLETLLTWRNSERVHSMMLTNHKITWDEHCNWYKNIEKFPVKLNFIYEYKSRSIGYIGYTDYDQNKKTCTLGLYLGEITDLPPKAGIMIYYVGIIYAFNQLKIKKLNMLFLENNNVSLEISRFLGFHSCRDSDYTIEKNEKNIKVVHLCLSEEEWNKNKKVN